MKFNFMTSVEGMRNARICGSLVDPYPSGTEMCCSDLGCFSECPLDLREAIASLIFAAPRCADVEELAQVRSILGSKYGKEFVAAASELRPDCGVSRNVSKLYLFGLPGMGRN
jgi:hypothetical protein